MRLHRGVLGHVCLLIIRSCNAIVANARDRNVGYVQSTVVEAGP